MKLMLLVAFTFLFQRSGFAAPENQKTYFYSEIDRKNIQIIQTLTHEQEEIVVTTTNFRRFTGGSRFYYRPNDKSDFYQLPEAYNDAGGVFLAPTENEPHRNLQFEHGQNFESLTIKNGAEKVEFKKGLIATAGAKFMRLPTGFRDIIGQYKVKDSENYVLLTVERFSLRTYEEMSLIFARPGQYFEKPVFGILGMLSSGIHSVSTAEGTRLNISDPRQPIAANTEFTSL
jgi:hypothetical protein